jgi:hypothetical protein
MDLENNFRKIRESVNINDKKVLEHKKHPDDTWSQYDSQLPEFGGTFFKTLPSEYTKNINLKTDVEIFGEPFKNILKILLRKIIIESIMLLNLVALAQIFLKVSKKIYSQKLLVFVWVTQDSIVRFFQINKKIISS